MTIWGSCFNYFHLVHVSKNHFFKMCWVRKGKRVEENWPLWFVLIEFFFIDVQNWKLRQRKSKMQKKLKNEIFLRFAVKVVETFVLKAFLKTSTFRKVWNFLSLYWDNFLISPRFPNAPLSLVKAVALFPCCYITFTQPIMLLVLYKFVHLEEKFSNFNGCR